MRYLIFLSILFAGCSKEPIEPEAEYLSQYVPEYVVVTPVGWAYDIYVCLGQSNTVGWSTLEPQDTGSKAFLFTGAGWEKADYDLNRHSTISIGHGLGWPNSFGKALGNRTRPRLRRAGLVVNAKESTTIQQWRYGGFLAAGITRIKQALAANPGNQLKGIFWQQGESNETSYSDYLVHLAWLADTLRQEFPNVPIAFIQVPPKPYYANINAQIANAPTVIPNCRVVTTENLTTHDQWHFDSPSSRTLGLRVANP